MNENDSILSDFVEEEYKHRNVENLISCLIFLHALWSVTVSCHRGFIINL